MLLGPVMYCIIEFILKYFLSTFQKKIKDVFQKRMRTELEKKVFVTGFFSEILLELFTTVFPF